MASMLEKAFKSPPVTLAASLSFSTAAFTLSLLAVLAAFVFVVLETKRYVVWPILIALPEILVVVLTCDAIWEVPPPGTVVPFNARFDTEVIALLAVPVLALKLISEVTPAEFIAAVASL